MSFRIDFSAVFVHFLIVILIFAVDDVFPPVLVVQIPLNGLLDTVFEHGLGQPSQLVVDLGRIDRIAAVMAGTVLDIGDQVFAFAQG